MMTDTYGTGAPVGTGAGTPPTGAGTTGVGSSDAGIKEQAAGLGREAASSGQHVAGVARDQAGRVTGEVGTQARQLFDQAKGEVSSQASTQQERVANGLRTMSDQLRQMGDNAEQDGMARTFVRQAADRTGAVADWVNQRNPGDLLDEVKGFARRRPGVFIALAVGAGLVAGRLTRAMVSSAKEESGGAGQSGRTGESGGTYLTPPATAAEMPPTQTTQGTAPVSATGMPRTGVDPDLVSPEAPGPMGGRMGGAG